MLDAEKYPEGARTGFKYSSFTVNVPRYLVYLLQKAKNLGAHVIQEDLPTTSGLHGALIKAMDVVQERSSIKESISVFVNATGLGSFKLVPDPTMFPIRGHTVTVSGEAKRITTINFKPNPEKPSEPVVAYILPRLRSNTTVIGGTKQSGNWNAEPDQATTDEILERAKPFVPELLNNKGDFTVVSVQVGLRPGRKQGVRVELEKVGEFAVCHAYGHAGAGRYH
jgi:D-amino-acid oxidase